jgi:flagellar biosynthetic protein FliS
MRQAAHAYLETQVTTTSQGQVLIMLYDGAINFLTRAKDLIDAKDYAGKGNLISSAIDIINELASSLNQEKGGDLANNLSQLYFYCVKRLFTANSRMNKEHIDEVITILGGIRSAYAQILDTPEAQAALAQKAPPSPTGMRVPVGAPSAPAGTPVHKNRVHNAYASQGAATTPHHAAPEPASPMQATAFIPLASPIKEAGAAPTERMPETPKKSAGVPDFEGLALAPPSSLGGKRPEASALYRKFTS